MVLMENQGLPEFCPNWHLEIMVTIRMLKMGKLTIEKIAECSGFFIGAPKGCEQ